MVPEINYWAVLIATASSMVVGSIWYTPKVFGTRWAKLANVDMDRPGASAVLPIIVGIVIYFLNPPYMRLLFTHPIGKLMVAIAGVMQIIGYIWIRRIVDIEI